MRILFLDIDGPLTTQRSRAAKGCNAFDSEAVKAFNHLLRHGRPQLCVVHSAWRKLPEPAPGAWADDGGYFWSHALWQDLCRRQGLHWDAPLEDAPFEPGSDRGREIGFWLDANPWAARDARLVIVDDQMHLIRPHAYARWATTLLLKCDDENAGLTLAQAEAAVAFWKH